MTLKDCLYIYIALYLMIIGVLIAPFLRKAKLKKCGIQKPKNMNIQEVRKMAKKYQDLKHKDSKRRRYNYKQLRKAGYNSHEANRFKDMSTVKIVNLINARKTFNSLQSGIVGGKRHD